VARSGNLTHRRCAQSLKIVCSVLFRGINPDVVTENSRNCLRSLPPSTSGTQYSVKRALWCTKRARYSIKRALCPFKRAQYSIKRARYSGKRALCSLNRARYSIKRALSSLPPVDKTCFGKHSCGLACIFGLSGLEV